MSYTGTTSGVSSPPGTISPPNDSAGTVEFPGSPLRERNFVPREEFLQDESFLEGKGVARETYGHEGMHQKDGPFIAFWHGTFASLGHFAGLQQGHC